MKVFLDVGAHRGQTLAAVLDQQLGFDRIVCFEPSKSCWEHLEAIEDARVSIKHFGLWDRNCKAPIFEPGSQTAGLWKKDEGRFDETEVCKFKRASDWMRDNVAYSDVVYLKLNCEGAECDILDDLLDSGEFVKVNFAMIDFDVRKISSQAHREAEVRARLQQFRFPRVAFSKQVMCGDTHEERIRNWLRLVELKAAA
jgi:FkbM family methyltransferase